MQTSETPVNVECFNSKQQLYDQLKTDLTELIESKFRDMEN